MEFVVTVRSVRLGTEGGVMSTEGQQEVVEAVQAVESSPEVTLSGDTAAGHLSPSVVWDFEVPVLIFLLMMNYPFVHLPNNDVNG
jgi:hypothetical protein